MAEDKKKEINVTVIEVTEEYHKTGYSGTF